MDMEKVRHYLSFLYEEELPLIEAYVILYEEWLNNGSRDNLVLKTETDRYKKILTFTKEPWTFKFEKFELVSKIVLNK